MKTVVVSDTHGSDVKSCFDSIIYKYNDDFDKLVFLGDYVGKTSVDKELQIKRLLDLIDIRKELGDRCSLLIGNWDAVFLDLKDDENHQGFSKEQCEKLSKVYNENLRYFDFAFSDGKYIYSHAGLTKDQMKELGIYEDEVSNLNKMLQAKMFDELFRCKGGLKYKLVNIFYKKYDELIKNPYHSNQIVGHFDSKGPFNINGIMCIEDSYHSRYMLVENK